MKILAVDLGLARTGLAVCDESELLASPAGVISEKNEEKLIAEISRRAAELNTAMLVVGYPRNMDG
ncbi:MAG TPA: Holliday junction resolvase RuvX, partial [Ruminococcaceae bacterium]|nr:Holliday junction resolvase RuvX [Oscillospiraceae bacterium]